MSGETITLIAGVWYQCLKAVRKAAYQMLFPMGKHLSDADKALGKTKSEV